MKRFFMLLFVVVAFAACEQVYVDVANDMSAGDRSLSVSFEDDDTRIQLNEAQKTVWTKGDLVSVFYRSSVNEQWQFEGETGDRVGDIVPVDNSVNPPATHNRVVVVYPYNAGYFLNTETYSIEASLPAVQSYLKDSYGTDGNIMVSSSNYKQVSLKSVCGWLKLQLTGNGEVVKSITLRGNNGEQVAGELHINTSDATCVLASASGDAGDDEVGGTLVRPGTILYDVTLDCGEGVTLGAEPTAFYIALPPQTFEKGFTVDVECEDYKPMTISTENTVTIERNHIQPMAGIEHNAIPVVPNNQIWYTSSDGNVVTPNRTYVFGVNIVSNTYNNGKGVITFDGDVTEIGEEAFYRCNTLIGVTIPDSVTTIGKLAFYNCTSLTSVTIPDSVTTIVDRAFGGCHNLTSVTIPDSVTAIGDYAFDSCSSLTSITIPDGVTTIESETFSGCSSLTSITIPDSVTTIGYEAFRDCTSLTSVTIGDSVTSIGYYAFDNCSSLISVYCYATIPPSLGGSAFYNNASGRRIYVYEECIELYKSAWSEYMDSINTNGQNCPETTTIEYTTNDGNTITSSKLPIISNIYENGVGTLVFSGKEIPSSAFLECTNLTSVNIPNSVTTIGDYAFCDCESLTSVNIPDSVTTIGRSTFSHCSSLTGVTIGDSVTTIGDFAFGYCDSLTSVTIGDSVMTIGNYAFDCCSSLTSVTIPDSVTTIGDSAFSHCSSLTSVTIGDSVTAIGNRAFEFCTSLTSVTIPDSVTEIRYYAFGWCTSLTSVYCKATTPPSSGSDVFDYNGSGRKIYVPAGSVNAYKSAEGWSEYRSYIVGYNF